MNAELISRFRALFTGLEHAHGLYDMTNPFEVPEHPGKFKGKASTLREPATDQDWDNHFTTKLGIGIAPIREDDTCWWGCLDADNNSVDHVRLAGVVAELRLPLVVCRSKSGGAHGYLFCLEPIPAAKMIVKLEAIRAEIARKIPEILVNADGSKAEIEIFPKQDNNTEGSCASWVNMPYAQGDNTGRYAVDAEGMALNAEQFLTLAEDSKVGPEFFNQKRNSGDIAETEAKEKPRSVPLPEFRENDPFNDGPPCLQHLFREGFPIGEWNNGMLEAGIFCRLANPNSWQNDLVQINRLSYPDASKHPDSDLTPIINSLTHKYYQYRCGYAHLRERCNEAECKERIYGIRECRRRKGGEIDPDAIDPDGFMCNDKGLYFVEGKKEVKHTWVSGPIYFKGWSRTPEDEHWSKLFEFETPEKTVKQMVIDPKGIGFSNTACIKLEESGLYVRERPILNRFLTNASNSKYITRITTTGWVRTLNRFMLPSGPVPRVEGEEYVYQGKTCAKFGSNGSLEEWKANVARYCVGNSLLTFATSVGFLGPVLPLLDGYESRAFNLYCYSSKGKTVSIRVAGSIYGKRFFQDWGSTVNGFEAMAQDHNHCLLSLDEIGKLDNPAKAGHIIYGLISSVGKARLTRDAELKDRRSWLIVVLSTGEVPLETFVKSHDKEARVMGGQEVRFLEIPADVHPIQGSFENVYGMTPKAFAEMLEKASDTYYGTALQPWLETLATRKDELASRILHLASEFERRYAYGAEAQVGRAAKAFALVAAAGSLATEVGITGWPPDEADKAAVNCFKSWQEARGTAGSSDEAAILKQVRRFYQAHGDARFKKEHYPEGKERDVVNMAGYYSNCEFLTFDQVFESEVCHKFHLRQVLKALHKAGYLVTDESNGGLRYKARRPDPRKSGKNNRTRFYVIHESIIAGEDDQGKLSIDNVVAIDQRKMG